MSEAGGSNFEIAKHLTGHHSERQEIAELAEALVLAVVAVATAWSGYQAALWTGHQAQLYGLSGRSRVEAEGAATAAYQEKFYNQSLVVEWVKAKSAGDEKLATLFERRLLPEFRPAFEAWKKRDPLHNPDAPASVPEMSEYRSELSLEAATLNEKATATFEEGTRARDIADRYVRATVSQAHRAPADRHRAAVQDPGSAAGNAGGGGGAALFSRLSDPDFATRVTRPFVQPRSPHVRPGG
jgi:hypothetical protein